MKTPTSRQVRKLTSRIVPSPENVRLYRQTRDQNLEDAIRTDGILEPLVVTRDLVLVSGHRRHAAAVSVGLREVPCRVLSRRRSDFSDDDFVRLLREFNRQRSKTIDEVLREAKVDADPEVAYASLVEERVKRARNGKGHFEIEGRKKRSKISAAKQPMLQAAIKVIESMKEFWALTIRQIHYILLGDPPVFNANHPERLYKNDRPSSKDLSDLLTRARIFGLVPWEAIKDETRPVRLWRTYSHVGFFVKEQLSQMFGGYWRDLQQSQPDHLEIFVEKNASLGVIDNLGMKYCIPISSGRGNSSKPPLKGIADRFKASGKRRLVLLLLSDFDPDGDSISHSTARCIRDDHDIPDNQIVPVRVAIRPDQIKRFNLPRSLEAKKTSSNYDKYVAKHGVTYAVELEALPPRHLQAELEKAILAHLDVKLFNAEVECEKQEAAKLQPLKRRAIEFTIEQPDIWGTPQPTPSPFLKNRK